MLKALTPSKSIKSSYNSPSKTKDPNFLELDITGRSPSVLTYQNNSPQGDHVTAYRLVEEGLYKRLSGLAFEEVECLFDLTKRNLLRERRRALFDYISAIAVLDLQRKESFYHAIDEILISYNANRHKKTDIKDKIMTFHDDQYFTGIPYEEALKGQEARYRENGEKFRDVFRISSALLLTFYNKIPLTSFHHIDGFKEGSGDIKASIAKIGEVLKWLEQQPKDTQISSIALATKRPIIVDAMNSLIHYPEITDLIKLQNHQAENIDKKGKTNQPRNNTRDTLIIILSRHIHIFFSVYPELKNAFNRDGELVDDFVDKFIGNQIDNLNWPSFQSDTERKSLKDALKISVIALEDDVDINHYSKWKLEKNAIDYVLDSSDDEDITTKPLTKIIPLETDRLSSITTHEREVDVKDIDKELKELRSLKEIILSNREIIPLEVMRKVDETLRIDSDKKHLNRDKGIFGGCGLS